jgi:type II secretory pathway pseudopilin PulG
MKGALKRTSNAGLSWPEVLFVISVLLIFASIIVPAALSLRNRNGSVRAYADMRILISAANRYNSEYRLWPVFNPPAQGDARYGDRISNAGVFRILSAEDGEGNENHRSNPSRINFVDLVADGAQRPPLNKDGELVDPWGSPYQMVFDSDYNSICSMENSRYGQIIGEGFIIWSKGPDRRTHTEDDLVSWKR